MRYHYRLSTKTAAGESSLVSQVVSAVASTDGPRVYRTGNSWAELGVTFTNKPAAESSVLDNKVKTVVGRQEYVVTPTISGDGTWTLTQKMEPILRSSSLLQVHHN